MVDGLIQDDIELLEICFQLENSNLSDSIAQKKQFVNIVYKFPYTTAANLVSKFLDRIRTTSDLSTVCIDIIKEYENWSWINTN